MKNKYLILIISLVILAILSIGFNIYEYQSNNNLKKEINIVNEGKNQPDEQIAVLNQEKSQLSGQVTDLNNQVSTLNSQIDILGIKIKGYLKAEGKITVEGKKCEDEVEFCLVKLTERLTSVSGIDCSPIADGSCPLWCAAGSDFDCCEKKTGYIWIQGRGCVDVSQI